MRRYRPLLRVLALIAVTIPLEVGAVEPSSPFLEQCVERFQAEGLDLGDARLAAAASSTARANASSSSRRGPTPWSSSSSTACAAPRATVWTRRLPPARDRVAAGGR
jgi:type IV secretory pathway TrbL component